MAAAELHETAKALVAAHKELAGHGYGLLGVTIPK